MLQPLLLHRSLIALAALAALALASPWLDGARADAAQVTVVSPGGEERPLALEALAGEDVVDGAYVLRSSAGESTKVVSGFSVGAILEAAGADPFSFSYLEVQRPGGGSVVLSRHQALDPGAFPDGPPVVYPTAGGTGFIRPSAGPGDLNAADCFEAPQGVRIVLRKGVQLQVRAEANPRRTKPGEKVSFSAAVEGAGSGEAIEYSWYFDDGNAATGPNPVHSFAKPGSYDVVVSVTAPGNETGDSAVVTVQVGDPAAGGPDRKGGGTNEAKDAPDHGAATGPATGTPGAGSESAVLPPPAPSASIPPAPAPAPEPESRQPPPQTAPEPEGEPVSGLLLEEGAAAAPEEAEPEDQPAAARTGTLSEKGSGGGGLSTAALGILATAGLIGAGAFFEAGGLGRLSGRSWGRM